jgi:hypothetical protein
MKTRQYLESIVYGNNSCTSSQFYEVDGKKFKFSYSNGNAYERFYIELFDGFKLNPIADIADLGIKSNSSLYHNTEIDNQNRISEVMSKARKYVETLIKI